MTFELLQTLKIEPVKTELTPVAVTEYAVYNVTSGEDVKSVGIPKHMVEAFDEYISDATFKVEELDLQRFNAIEL